MNEPIISPWLIYWAGRIEFIHYFCLTVGFTATVTAAVYAVAGILTALTEDYPHDGTRKLLKISVCAALILDTLAFLVPTKEEILAMYTAQYITPANIKATGEFADKAVDKLIEKILKASKAVKE